MLVYLTDKPLDPGEIISRIKTLGCGCVATYVGVIRDNSRGKQVVSVKYSDSGGTAQVRLEEIVRSALAKWSLEDMAIVHRLGMLEVGDFNLVVAVAAAHRIDGFAACQYAVDQFKEIMPTDKEECYSDDGFSPLVN